jgi:hypothetical protein
MKTHLEMLAASARTTIHSRRGRFEAYGTEFPFEIGNRQSEKAAKEKATEHAIARLDAMRRQAGRELTLQEEVTGEFSAPVEPTPPRSRAAERAADTTPASDKLPEIKSTNLQPSQVQRRQAALDRAREKLAAREAGEAAAESAANDPERVRLVTFAEKCLQARQADPKAKSTDVLAWMDVVRDSKSKPIGETWQRIKALGVDEPSRVLPENAEWNYDPLLKG